MPYVGWDSSDGIATRYGLDGPGIESRWGARFSAPVQTGPGGHPASCTMGTVSLPGVKRPGRGVDHPPHLASRLKKEYSYTSTSPLGLLSYAFYDCVFTFGRHPFQIKIDRQQKQVAVFHFILKRVTYW